MLTSYDLLYFNQSRNKFFIYNKLDCKSANICLLTCFYLSTFQLDYIYKT